MSVFIVDDSRVIRERLIEMLSEISGVEVVGQAKDRQEASDLINSPKPDTAILDIRMPGLNGIDLLKYIKQHNLVSWVIMLSNCPTPQYLNQCIKAGADFFFEKSSQFDMIPLVMESLMRKSRND